MGFLIRADVRFGSHTPAPRISWENTTSPAVRASPSFVITAYRPDHQGELVPEIPDEGVCRGWDERPCRVRYHHTRERKTGPCFPLTVVRCQTHRRAFALYPPGHVPYGRRAVAPVAPDGSPVRRAPAGTDDGGGRQCAASVPEEARAFAGTVFDAALDAAQGKAWKHDWQLEHPEAGTRRGWTTQRRLLLVTTRLVGVASVVSAAAREQVAQVLSVSGQLLSELGRRLSSGGGYRAQGEAVVEVLAVLGRGQCLADRIVESGYIVGLWSAPMRWDARRGLVLRAALGPSGPRAPPAVG